MSNFTAKYHINDLNLGVTIPAHFLIYNGKGKSQDNLLFFAEGLNNRLAMGITAPTDKFHINDSINNDDMFIKITNSNSTNGISFGLDSNENFIIKERDGNELQFWTNELKRMIIDSTGNIGINTDTPSTQLDVWGGLDISSATPKLITSSVGTPRTSDITWQFSASSIADQLIKFNLSDNTASGTNEIMRITGDGLVGINKDAPTFNLDVIGDINTTVDYNIGGVSVLSATTLESAVVNSSLTNLGTLTTLDVSGATTLAGLTTSGNIGANTTSPIYDISIGDPNSGLIWNSGTDTLELWVNGVLHSQFADSGDNLIVSGVVMADGFQGSVSANSFFDTDTLFVDATNNRVGIGTATPSSKLDVFGDIFISGTSVLTSTTLGSGVVNSSLTSVGTLTSLDVNGGVSITNVSGTQGFNCSININSISGATRYYELATFLVAVGGAGNDHIQVEGIMAGHTPTTQGRALINLLFSERGAVSLEEMGYAIGQFGTNDIVVYEDGTAHHIYAVVSDFAQVNLNVKVVGGNINTNFTFDESFTTSTPSGTLRFTLSTDVGTNILRQDRSGNVGIGITTPNTSSVLDLTSTTGALLVPRMTTTQRNSLTATNGMIIYNTSTSQFNFRESAAWVSGSGLA